jgi:hypothetical protein
LIRATLQSRLFGDSTGNFVGNLIAEYQIHVDSTVQIGSISTNSSEVTNESCGLAAAGSVTVFQSGLTSSVRLSCTTTVQHKMWQCNDSYEQRKVLSVQEKAAVKQLA